MTFNRDSVALYTLISPEEREETLKTIEQAYSILSDPEKRRLYDQNFSSFSSNENPFSGKEQKGPPAQAKVISIDRVPPMENPPEGDNLLIPPKTDFTPISAAQPPGAPSPKAKNVHHEWVASSRSQPTPSEPPSRSNFVPPQSDLSVLTLDPALNQMIEDETEWKGSFLKKIRESYQISLEEMSTSTKITKTYLVAIEEENFSKLPATVYVRGFLIQISKILRLPHEKVATAYLSRYKGK